MATTVSGLMTFAEFERLPDDPGLRYELRHGEVHTLPPPKYDHHSVQQQIRDFLFEPAGGLGRVSTELGFRPTGEYEY